MARILIVEDEASFRGIIADALSKEGHSVLEAGEGRTAEQVLKTETVDLVISDIQMPEVDGIDMIIRLRDVGNPVPIIVMTGGHLKAEFYLKIATSLGARRVLAKPFTVDELVDLTREVLAESRARS